MAGSAMIERNVSKFVVYPVTQVFRRRSATGHKVALEVEPVEKHEPRGETQALRTTHTSEPVPQYARLALRTVTGFSGPCLTIRIEKPHPSNEKVQPPGRLTSHQTTTKKEMTD